MKTSVVLTAIALAVFLTLGGFIAASAQNAANSGVDGEWQAIYKTPIGEMTCRYTFNTAGDRLTGKVVAEMGGTKSESEITEGKIDGDMITFVWLYNNDIKMVCTGKITGDEIKLSRQAGSYGTEEAVATRVSSDK